MKGWLKQKLVNLIAQECTDIISKRKLEIAWDVLEQKYPDDNFVMRYKKDFKIRLALKSRLARLLFYENFEEAELKFAESFLQKGNVFFDIGANVGLFSLIAAKAVGPTGKVYSFEPSKSTFENLIYNSSVNGFSTIIEPIQAGISSDNGVLIMHESNDGFDAWNSFGKPSMGESFSEIEVPVKQLDEFIDKNPNLIKIDVEGWEKNVLLGGRKLLTSANNCALLIEFTEANLKNASTSSGEIHDIMKEYGYKVFELDKNGKPKQHIIQSAYEYSNLLFVKEESLFTSLFRN